MFLRKKSRRKTEISFDEPLNVDYDGNELLLSDILGTEGDIVAESFYAEEDKRQLLKAMSKLKENERMILETVSYTHLDVYKRQDLCLWR